MPPHLHHHLHRQLLRPRPGATPSESHRLA
jgi:hypothetical protein